MNQREPFIDIHCHLLPDLDDGPSNWDQSLAMARMAFDDGFTAIVATPHQLGNYPHNSVEKIQARLEHLRLLLEQKGIDLKLFPGADVRIDPDLPAKVLNGQVFTLAGRGRHVLLELPHEVYISLDRLLAELHSGGLTGILSHPERNQGILNQPEILRKLADQGCLFQLTAGSLLGMFGSRTQKLSESILRQGLVHFIATDAHGIKSRTPLLSPAFNRVLALEGYDTAVKLFCRNPACVAAGESVPSDLHNPRRKPNFLSNNRFFYTSHRSVNFK